MAAGLVSHWYIKRNRITLAKLETGVNTIMVYLKYRQFKSSTPLVLNRLISIVIHYCNIGMSRENS